MTDSASQEIKTSLGFLGLIQSVIEGITCKNLIACTKIIKQFQYYIKKYLHIFLQNNWECICIYGYSFISDPHMSVIRHKYRDFNFAHTQIALQPTKVSPGYSCINNLCTAILNSSMKQF